MIYAETLRKSFGYLEPRSIPPSPSHQREFILLKKVDILHYFLGYIASFNLWACAHQSIKAISMVLIGSILEPESERPRWALVKMISRGIWPAGYLRVSENHSRGKKNQQQRISWRVTFVGQKRRPRRTCIRWWTASSRFLLNLGILASIW